jgi:methylglutaconyl-CoA hydratase
MVGNEGSDSSITIYKFVRSPQLEPGVTCWCPQTANTRARLLLLHTPHSGVFCAGADLRERRTMSQTQVSDFLDSLRSLISELEGINIPSIGVVDGYALGGGMEIALGCDLRVGGMFRFPSRFMSSTSAAGGTEDDEGKAK